MMIQIAQEAGMYWGVSRLVAPLRAIKLVAFAMLGLWCAAGLVQAQLPAPRLDTVFPPGAPLGSTNVVVTFAGEHLEDARMVISRVGGLEVFPQRTAGEDDWGDRASFRLSVPGLAKPGVYDVRIVGRYGVSNPRRWVMGTESQKVDTGSETDPAKAIALAPGEAVLGRIESGNADYFRLDLKKGDRVRLECQASILDSRLDPVVKILDPDRREVSRGRSLGEVSYVAAVDGVHLVKLHDFLNGGGDAYVYRLVFKRGPQIDRIFPAAIRLGQTNAVQVVGRELPGGHLWTNSVMTKSPSRLERDVVEASLVWGDSPVTNHHRSVQWSKQASGWLDQAVWNSSQWGKDWPEQECVLGVTRDPVMVEKEPNSNRGQAQVIQVPCDLTGTFFPRGDQDWFTFEAKKGEVWVVEGISQRLGTGADPYLYMHRVVKKEKGQEKAEDEVDAYDTELPGAQDFSLSTGDPVIRYEVKADGWIRLMIRDQAQSVYDDPLRLYRLVIRREQPDFRMAVVPAIPPSANKDARDIKVWTSSVRRGGVVPLRVWVWRREGMDAPIEVSIPGLPEGVSCVGGIVPSGQNTAVITLDVATNAPGWSGGLNIVGKARMGEVEIIREAAAGSVTWSVGDYNLEKVLSRVVDQWALGVIDRDAAPFRVVCGQEGLIQACPGMKVQIPVSWQASKDVQGKAKMRLVGHPALGAGKEIEVEGKPGGQSQVEIDLAQTVIPVGEHWLYWQGQVGVKYLKDEALLQRIEEDKKGGEEKKKQAEERAKKAAARDLTDYFYSPAFRLQVLPAPLQMEVGTNTIVVATNATSPFQVQVQCKRLFGFGEAIELTGSFPEKTPGLQVDKATVPKDKSEIAVVLKTGSELKTGEYPLLLKAAVKWNGQDLAMTRRVMVRVP